MAEWWCLALCVFLTSLSVLCANTPEKQPKAQQQAQVLNQTRVILGEGRHGASGLDIAVGQIQQMGKTVECTLSEAPGGRTLNEIIDAGAQRSYKFFIKPELGFNELIINVKLRHKWLNTYSTNSFTISSSRMEIDWTQPTWIPVKIEYFKKVRRLSPDRHALHVRVGEGVSEELVTSKWWRTYSYEGFEVFALGPLKVLTNCRSWVTAPEPEPVVNTRDSRSEHTLLIVGVLAGCLLVVGGAAVFCLVTRRCRSSQEYHNHLLSVPKRMPKQQGACRDSVGENIYETIDENTLKKLRQKCADTRTGGSVQPVQDCSGCSQGDYQNTKAFLNSHAHELCHSSGLSSNVAAGMLAINLREQKEASREDCGLNSPVESHYVEMHSIVSRTSSLTNK